MSTRAARILAVPTVAVLLAGGFWLAAATIGEGTTSFWAGVGWWALATLVLLLIVRARRELRVPVIATLALTTVAALALFWTVTRESQVSEEIAVGSPAVDSAAGGTPPGRGTRDAEGSADAREKPMNVELASGRFEGTSGHSGTGKAAVVELAEGGRVLTLSDFDVDAGAGLDSLRVYLAAGKPSSDGEVSDFEEIAKLKGTKGDQQYELPRKVDIEKHGSVIVWCVPFSTRIAQAEIE